MKLRLQRLLPLLLLFLISLLSTTFALEPAQDHSLDGPASRDRADAPYAQHSGSGASHNNGYHGASAVQEATAMLRKLKPPSNRLGRFSRPSGILGTTAYYAKELFFLLFMNGPPQHDLLTTKAPNRKLSQPLIKAVKLLEGAAAEGNPDAIFMLAEMNFYGNYSHPRNYQEAFRRYNQLAALDGNSSAQHMIGFMYATGIGGAVKQDQAKAMLYHTFAAEAGDIRSQMTIAYRHHTGIATPRNCEEAVHYFKKVADKAIEYLRSGPPGGHAMVKEAYRLADDQGGVYGEGASVSSAGPNAKIGPAHSDTHAAFDDVMEYLDLMSRKGDLKATFNLAKIHYDGSRAMKRDLRLAKQYFLDVARHYWRKDGSIKSDVPPGTDKLASKAAGYLGRMFLRGEGMQQSFQIAQTWFNRGMQNGDALSQYSMGLMYLHGYGVPKDPVRAADYFGAAADQDLASAQVQLGILFLDQGDLQTAVRYFDLASRNNHIEAFYYLAEMANQGIGRDRSCGMAAVYYKVVAEKAEAIVSSIREANEAYEAGDLETALVDYMMAAEQGFESAQANVAWLLDQARRPRFTLSSLLPFPSTTSKHSSLIADAALALLYWTRSAAQQNIDSMVKTGDYYLLGLGTSPDAEKAAACYQAAAETQQGAQAQWNLGWMHENGVGVAQDFHLAKRHYDHALATNPREAYLPVRLALGKLRVRSWWNRVTHGRVNSIKDEPAPKKDFSLSEWLTAFLEAENAAGYWENNVELDDYDAVAQGMPGGDEYYDELDGELVETLVILGLAATLAFLVYYRQQRQAGQRAAEEAARQGQQGQEEGEGRGEVGERAEERGLFPPPDDPNFNNWVVGGVGH